MLIERPQQYPSTTRIPDDDRLIISGDGATGEEGSGCQSDEADANAPECVPLTPDSSGKIKILQFA